jgi:hypothetical protein
MLNTYLFHQHLFYGQSAKKNPSYSPQLLSRFKMFIYKTTKPLSKYMPVYLAKRFTSQMNTRINWTLIINIFLAIALIGVDMGSDMGVISSMITLAWDLRTFENGFKALTKNLQSTNSFLGFWDWQLNGIDSSPAGKEDARNDIESLLTSQWAVGITIISICVLCLSLMALVRFSPLPGLLNNAASAFSMGSSKHEQENKTIPLGKLTKLCIMLTLGLARPPDKV